MGVHIASTPLTVASIPVSVSVIVPIRVVVCSTLVIPPFVAIIVPMVASLSLVLVFLINSIVIRPPIPSSTSTSSPASTTPPSLLTILVHNVYIFKFILIYLIITHLRQVSLIIESRSLTNIPLSLILGPLLPLPLLILASKVQSIIIFILILKLLNIIQIFSGLLILLIPPNILIAGLLLLLIIKNDGIGLRLDGQQLLHRSFIDFGLPERLAPLGLLLLILLNLGRLRCIRYTRRSIGLVLLLGLQFLLIGVYLKN